MMPAPAGGSRGGACRSTANQIYPLIIASIPRAQIGIDTITAGCVIGTQAEYIDLTMDARMEVLILHAPWILGQTV